MKTQLELGATLDTLNRQELHEELAEQAQEVYQQFARGMKYLRFGPEATPVAASTFSLDGSGRNMGPRAGFVWSVRRLTVWGLTAGATPDVANLYRNSPQGVPVWQFNGNNFAYTFGKLELLLYGGETLSLAGSGTIAATGNISISGDVQEVAAEEISKLF